MDEVSDSSSATEMGRGNHRETVPQNPVQADVRLEKKSPVRGAFIGFATFAVALPVLVLQARLLMPIESYTNDSFSYLAGAVSIAKTGKYWTFSDGWSLHFPPGTSLIFAAASLISGKPPESLILPVQALALLTSCLALGLLAARAIRSSVLAILCVAVVILNTEILPWHLSFGSDPWAFAMANVCLLALAVFLADRRRSWRWLVCAGLLAGLAVTTRWAMLHLVVLVVAAGVFWARPGRRLLSAGAATAACAVPPTLAILLTRPHSRLEAWTYSGRDLGIPDFENIGRFADQFVPVKVLGGAPAILFLGVLLFLLVAGSLLVAFRIRVLSKPSSLEGANSSLERTTPKIRMLWLFSAAAVGYLALVWLAPLTTRQAQPVVRIQAPAMPMLVFGAILAIEALQSDRPNARWRWSAAMIVVVGGLGIALARSCRSWALELGSAPDPASASRARNVAAAVAELQNLTRSLPQDCNLVSNAPALVWYLTRRPATAFGEDPRFVLQRDRGKRREIAVVARGGIEGLDYFIYSKAPHKFAMPVVRTRALLFAGSYWGVWETGIADQGRVGGDIRRHLANSYPMSSVVGVAGVPARKLE